MSTRQFDIQLKNEPGQVASIIERLGENGIDTIALSVSTDGDTGRLRFLVNDPVKAANILKSADFPFITREVLACEIPDHPGGLNAILKPLREAGINLDYIYPSLGPGHTPFVILGMDPLGEAVRIMQEHWITVLGEAPCPS